MSVPDIHREVLDNLLDGVLVVGLGGTIESLNPAAESILGLEPGEAAGGSFGELLIMREGFDEFTELVIDATAQRSGGERRVVEIRSGGEARSLSVATSYLRMVRGDGVSEAVAVIVVFSDISELRELRETELRLAKAVEEQHGRLQTAYREIEERNTALAGALRKVRVQQWLGMVVVIGLFLGAGFWTWQPLDLFEGSGAVEAASTGPARAQNSLIVDPRPVSSSVTLKGRLAPWRTVDVRSPVSGAVAAVMFRVGDEVAEGETLLELDLSDLGRKYQKERLRYRKARDAFETLDNWEASSDMASARRTFAKATLDMESERNKMRKNEFLHEQGLIAADDYDDARRQHESQLLDFAAAEEELAAVRAQGDAAAVEAARLDMEGARADMLELERGLAWDRIVAPVSGMVLAPERADKKLIAGATVRKGDRLLRIGDFSRLAATAQVDEVDVGKLAAGQQVTVTGNAFAGLRLKGMVSRVAAEADAKARGIPKFDVTVTLDPLEPAVRARLRAGMSGRLKIVTYSNPKALLVPIDAVQSRGGTHRLRVVDGRTGEAQEREVEIGPTTRDSVEITAGLKAGETIVLPGG